MEYRNSKADIKYITSNEGGGGTLAGIRSENFNFLDLTDSSWDWNTYTESGVARASNNVMIGSPLKIKFFLPNLSFEAGLSFWKPLQGMIDIEKGNFNGWNAFADLYSKSVKATIDYNEDWSVPILIIERIETTTLPISSARLANIGGNYFGNKEILGNNRFFITVIIKTIKGGVNDVPFSIKMRGKKFRKTILLPNDWVLYVLVLKVVRT